jgi:hypothetical protein
MYCPLTDVPVNPANLNLGYRVARKSTQLRPDRILVTDLMYTYDSIPHRSSRNPNALNVLWGDTHASVCTSRDAFDKTIWNPVPGDTDSSFQKIIQRLRP